MEAEILITRASHATLLIITAVCLVIGCVGLFLVYSYYRLDHREKSKSTTWTKKQKMWARMGMVLLWGVAFAISYYGTNIKLTDYKKSEDNVKLSGKSCRLYVSPSHDNYKTKCSFGAESVILVDARPYAYLSNDGAINYYMRWGIGCATVFAYEEGLLGDLIDLYEPKISIPANSKIGVVLLDGSHVARKNWAPSKYYLHAGSRSDICRQDHDVYVHYSEREYKKLMSQPIDSIKIDTDTLHIGVRANCASKYKLCERMQALYDEMHYVNQIGINEYNPHWRLIDSFGLGLFVALSVLFLCFWSIVLPYKMYYL